MISAPFYTGHGQPLCHRQVLIPGKMARSRQPVPAGVGRQVSGGGGGGAKGQAHFRRERVTFLVPGRPPLQFVHVTQHCLERVLDRLGALGFETADGSCSQCLEDLPEGGAVKVVPAEPLTAVTQMRPCQASPSCCGECRQACKAVRIKELETLLHTLASAEHAGAAAAALSTVCDEDSFQLDVAVRAGHTLYLGEMRDVLDQHSMSEIEIKMARITAAIRNGALPSLAAAFEGVTDVQLFLSGERVRAGLTVRQLVGLAAAHDMSVVLPCGQGLALVGCAAPHVPL